MHIVRGRAVINGSGNGLVQFFVDPPLRTGRGLSTTFFRQRVGSIVLSMVEPDKFSAAIRPPSTRRGSGA